MLPLLIALELLPAGATSAWARYALNVLLVGYPYVYAIIAKLYPGALALLAITSRNAGSVRTRTVGSTLYNMCVQASNIISSNIYRTEDAPLYREGKKVLLGMVAHASGRTSEENEASSG